MTTIEKDALHNASPAGVDGKRLSVFGGWCRLLVCLVLLAAGQQAVRYLWSPASPTIQLRFAPSAAGQAAVGQSVLPQSEVVAAPQFMVDVNHAPQHELEALPEVGASLATRIVDYRQSQGPFRQIDDLLHVRGVGLRTLEQLRPMLLVRLPEGLDEPAE